MARSTKDKTGERFGRLVVVCRDFSKAHKRAYWLCKCDCGNTTVAPTGHLNAGMRVSCGCAQDGSYNRTHGKSHSPEYKAWENARSRCRNPKNRKYPLYGARGIDMCVEWAASFKAFYRDMGDRPSPQHSLDRIDGRKGYDPENCRWATIEEQNNNRSFNRRLVVDGKLMTIAEASRLTGVRQATILTRLNAGWSDKAAVRDV